MLRSTAAPSQLGASGFQGFGVPGLRDSPGLLLLDLDAHGLALSLGLSSVELDARLQIFIRFPCRRSAEALGLFEVPGN